MQMKYIQLFEHWVSDNKSDSPIYLIANSSNKKERSIEEMYLYEALKLKINKETNELVVVSDLEGREGSQETFINKNILKNNGFRWNKNNWTISADKLDIATSTLSLINKVDYIITSLEEVEEMVENSEESDKKNILKARLASFIEELANATDETVLSEKIRKYLDFFSKFHNYSYHNRIMIYIQRPDATRVASYRKWKEKNRQVKKGAKGISIFVPIIKNKEVTREDDDNMIDNIEFEDGDEQNKEVKKSLVGYRIGVVFDISDTEATSPEGEVPDEPQWWGDNTPSETADELFGYVSEMAKDMGIKVTTEQAMRGERGYAAGDHINISSGVEGVGRLSTMIHEIAHELMHFRENSIFYQGEKLDLTKELMELQAESVSYVVLKHYDLPASHHPTYLALWRANKDVIEANLQVISKVSQFIITKIDEQAEYAKQKSF